MRLPRPELRPALLSPFTVTALWLGLVALIATLAGCGHRDAFCDLDRPEVASIEMSIINGEVSTDRRSVVHVYNIGRSTTCTGTIVGPHTVLTAAHCVLGAGKSPGEPAKRVDVYVSGVRYGGSEGNYEAHPDYDRRGVRKFKGDMAVAWFDDVLPEPYASIAEAPTGCYPGLIAQGYGVDELGLSGPLRERIVYEVHHNKPIIYTTEGNCFGDSGGGLYAETPEGHTIIGVSSHARKDDCTSRGRKGAAGYTNLFTYGSWARARTF
jgi:hypothetical protein